MEQIAACALPLVMGIILIHGYLTGTNVFDCFVTGAKEGIRTTVKLLPTLIGLIIAVTMLQTSGLLDAIAALFRPLATQLGIAPELAPLAFLRPISGSGSSAYTIGLLQQFGPDSETGIIASVMSAATETTFYAIAVYFGATAYKQYRYTLPAALLGDVVTVIVAILSVKLR